MPDPHSLEGKKALVTGGKRRIGRGIALSLAEAGCDVGVNDLEEDADAVETARANVGLNDVGHIVQVRRADVRRAVLEPAAVVFANIHAALACRAAGVLAGLVSAGGTLVVGGVTGDEEDGVRRALAPYGALSARYAEEEWVALAIRA